MDMYGIGVLISMIDFLGMAGTQNRQHKIDTVLLISTYYYVLLEEV